ncbi:hypothetical protein [Mesorhizobium sp. LNJC403B00]|uniref:hypothetical protein n=1 Tax=unclassified Mesorhizobium TaxID=325217 RepID=UPI0003CDE837|nr:hypothetical protein [Mesorhizobium sp. LNJC403B00]ESX88264.1 hypothetical protein X754_26930 [Mesorhizobium sp. LNJC403B00]
MAKRAEISGAIRFNGATLADQLQYIDAVLLILGYEGDPAQITPFRRQPSKANKETAQRIVTMKG